MENDLSLLKNVPIFSELNENALQLILAKSRSLKFRKGAILMSEGETGESLYIINSGKVKIFVSDENGNEITLFIEGSGSYIGEISLLDDCKRSIHSSIANHRHIAESQSSF